MGDRRPRDAELSALRNAGANRDETLGELFEQHRRRLLRMIHVRMDARVKERVGASDVLQETYLEISRRIGDYLAHPNMPFFLWLRFLTAQKLAALHRHHVGTQKRDVRRQVPINRAAFPRASSAILADRLLARGESPSQVAVRAEMRRQVEEALDEMRPGDREVLVMRHFEEMSNVETAEELSIDPSAASKRYLRALNRLRQILEAAGVGDGA